ncbi:IS1096 element passenger TnpR family protein [Radiobacillus sp. PE A8.2]|uniref:IS1096 element passenger TnpR family protein n=1 Tax=Radiobacillus sp. PE A8.2 TaxID=3380349 RepID=UPI00388E60C4
MNNKTHQQLSFDSLFVHLEEETKATNAITTTKPQTADYKRNRQTFPIDLIIDFEKFIGYIEQHQIKLTKTKRYIAKQHLPYINEQLSLQAADVTHNSQQEYYPYIHFLFHLALSGELLLRHEDGLIITDRWHLFKELSETEKYCFLLEIFWVDLDWLSLSNQADYRSVPMMLPDVLDKLIDERAEHSLQLDRNPLLASLISGWHYFLLYFEWLGLWICETDQDKMDCHKVSSYYFAKTITLTTFGTKVIPILMHERELYQWNIPIRRWTCGEWNPVPGTPIFDEVDSTDEKQTPDQFYKAFVPLFPGGDLTGSLPRYDGNFVSGTYIFKVSFDTNVWRKVVLTASHTMEDLHHIIIKSYQFYDDHLYSFFLDGRKWSDYCVVAPLGDADKPSAAEVKIGSIGLRQGQQFMYLFDYGDEWTFTVTVDDLQEGESQGMMPYIKEEKGHGPQQYVDLD